MFTGSHEPELYGRSRFLHAQVPKPSAYCEPVSLT